MNCFSWRRRYANDELLEDYQGAEVIHGQGGLLKQLTKHLVERALSAKLSHHLEHEQLQVNPDWAGTELVPRDQRCLAGLEQKIIALY